jgi:SAM-dependent methyltransferase
VIATDVTQRATSFGQTDSLSIADRLGRSLSLRTFHQKCSTKNVKTAADIGCGYHADLARSLFPNSSLWLFDLSIDPTLASNRVTTVEGTLPDSLSNVPDSQFDVIFCNNVLEHLHDPSALLDQIARVLQPGGVAYVNVPSWWGKRALEFSAFRLGLSPREEMNDHRWYFDPKDLWPLLVRSGFRPDNISCGRHKLGLNTFAVCRKPAE